MSLRGGPDSLLDTYEAERLPIAAAVLGLSKRLHQTRPSSAAMLPTSSPCTTEQAPCPRALKIGRLHPGDRMPDLRSTTAAGSSIICAVVTRRNSSPPEGLRILIRPDGYIAHIGLKEFLSTPVNPPNTFKA